jgi:DnaK suppressor protein
MDHLSVEQLAELRRSLEEERVRIIARGPGHRAAALADEEPDPGDRQDLATEEARLRTDLTVSTHDRERLVEIDAALGRFESNTYGICEETGEPIPFARLQANPTTRYTVEALELLEDEQSRERVQGPDNDNDTVY